MVTLASPLEKIARKQNVRITPFGRNGGWAAEYFYVHILGIEALSPSRVLDIGAEEFETFEECFQNVEYEAVGFHVPANRDKKFLRGSFMDIQRPSYDIIVSTGVFEETALDRRQKYPGYGFSELANKRHNHARLEKLYGLTAPGGVHIHATISDPCIFSTSEIERAGFSVYFRTRGIYEDAELLAFRRPV